MTSQQNLFVSGQGSTDPHSLVGDSHASLGVLPGSDEARRMTATSGRRCLGLSRNSGPIGCLARMLLGSSIWGSTMRYLTWKPRGTKRGLPYFQLVPSEPSTEGIGSLLWRTPETSAGGTVSEEVLEEMAQGNWKRPSGQQRQLRLQDQVRHPALWPTPTTSDAPDMGENAETRKAKGKQVELRHIARSKMWPTPNARDHKGAPSAKWAGQSSLPREVKTWPTPTSRDHKDTGDLESVPTNSLLGREVGPSKASGSLNPTWVEWLMGFPIGWTDLSASETE